jgi:hypothetical protein
VLRNYSSVLSIYIALPTCQAGTRGGGGEDKDSQHYGASWLHPSLLYLITVFKASDKTGSFYTIIFLLEKTV